MLISQETLENMREKCNYYLVVLRAKGNFSWDKKHQSISRRRWNQGEQSEGGWGM